MRHARPGSRPPRPASRPAPGLGLPHRCEPAAAAGSSRRSWGRDPRPGRLGPGVSGPPPAERSRSPLPRLTLDRSVASPRDGFQKLGFRLHDGLAVETVLIPLHKPGAVSVCLSSQVGCAMGCVFCATARMTTRRNLATWEIVDQWVQARDLARLEGRRVTGACLHGDGRAVPELRPRDRRGRAAPVPLRRVDRGQGDHDQHRRPRPRDRPLHARGAPLPALDQPGSGDRREATGTRPGRRAVAGRRGHGRRPRHALRGATG